MLLIKKSRAGRMRPCPVSGARGKALQNLGPVAATQPGDFSAETFSLIYCSQSDMVYLSPLPTDEDFNVMYSAGQFDSSEYSDSSRIDAMMEYYSGCINRHFSIERETPFRLLEVGAGMSWVSKAIKSLRPDSQTWCQDISSECVDKCEWADQYFVGSVEDFSKQADTSFHAISLTHVIEHVPDPVKTLKLLSRMLTDDGVIMLTAPFRPKNWSVLQGLQPWIDYSYLHVPAHISYFSELALQMAAQKAGLSLKFWDSTADDHQAFEALLSPE
jgi:hypothetical protein